MAKEVITIPQLFHHRWIAEREEETSRRWIECFSWYPIAQAEHYKRYAEIYKESLAKYGDKKFDFYAQRVRLRKCFMSNGANQEQDDEFDDNQLKNLMGHLEHYKPSVTTNGEYGLIKPNRLFECFE